MSPKTIIQSAKKVKSLMSPSTIKKINAAGQQQKNYYKSLGALPKTASVEDMAELYMPPSVTSMVNSVGLHKVATEMLKQEGTDYGPAEKLNIVKVATILGTKLAMIHRENNSIVEGLAQLKELGE